MDSILHSQICQLDEIQKFDLLDMSATYKAKNFKLQVYGARTM